MNQKKRYVSVQEVADYLEVSKQSIIKWINEGVIKVYRLPSGRIKILKTDFLDYLRQHKLYIDPDFFDIQQKKIVVIDDDKKIHKIFQLFFNNLGIDFQIEYESDGVAGLLKIGALKPAFVILDIEMPGMEGIDVCRKVLSDTSMDNIKIIVISGFLDKYKDELEKLSVQYLISKPFKISDLKNQLLPILKGEI